MAKQASLKVEDYVVAVAAATGNTKKDTRIVIKEFLAQVTANTKAGIASQFVGLGKIDIREAEAGEKRNPKTGEKVWVEAHQKPKFGFSGAVKNALKGIEDGTEDAE